MRRPIVSIYGMLYRTVDIYSIMRYPSFNECLTGIVWEEV